MQYFIKRNEKINGPFTDVQIKSGISDGKLKDMDMISNSKEGPWMTLGMLGIYVSRQQQEGGSVESGDSESAAEIVVEIYKDLFKDTAQAFRKGIQDGIKQHEDGRTNEVAEEIVGGATDLMKGMARAFRQGVQDGLAQHEQRTAAPAIDTNQTVSGEQPSAPDGNTATDVPSTGNSRTNNCSDCGGLISVQVSTCPHCGAPTASSEPPPAPQQFSDAIKPSRYDRMFERIKNRFSPDRDFRGKKWLYAKTWRRWVFGGLAFLLLFLAGYFLVPREFRGLFLLIVGPLIFIAISFQLVYEGVKRKRDRTPGLHQLTKLGDPVGRTHQEIEAFLGPPTSVSSALGGSMVQWISPLSGHLVLIFGKDGVCIGAPHQVKIF